MRRNASFDLAVRLRAQDRVVLLGSIATPKYLEPLSRTFGSRLHYPLEFIGRGDMSRGSLMLWCAAQRRELTYLPYSNRSETMGSTRIARRAGIPLASSAMTAMKIAAAE